MKHSGEYQKSEFSFLFLRNHFFDLGELVLLEV